jgi:hypothetical protein
VLSKKVKERIRRRRLLRRALGRDPEFRKRHREMLRYRSDMQQATIYFYEPDPVTVEVTARWLVENVLPQASQPSIPDYASSTVVLSNPLSTKRCPT